MAGDWVLHSSIRGRQNISVLASFIPIPSNCYSAIALVFPISSPSCECFTSSFLSTSVVQGISPPSISVRQQLQWIYKVGAMPLVFSFSHVFSLAMSFLRPCVAGWMGRYKSLSSADLRYLVIFWQC